MYGVKNAAAYSHSVRTDQVAREYVGIAALVLWAVISVPLPLSENDVFVLFRVPVAIFIFIVYLGKTL